MPTIPLSSAGEIFWSGQRESNPRIHVGNVAHYHCAMSASFGAPDGARTRYLDLGKVACSRLHLKRVELWSGPEGSNLCLDLGGRMLPLHHTRFGAPRGSRTLVFWVETRCSKSVELLGLLLEPPGGVEPPESSLQERCPTVRRRWRCLEPYPGFEPSLPDYETGVPP